MNPGSTVTPVRQNINQFQVMRILPSKYLSGGSRRHHERYFRLDRKHAVCVSWAELQETFGILFSCENDKFSPVNVVVLCVNDYEATIEERNSRFG
jgi:hypothetical protein